MNQRRARRGNATVVVTTFGALLGFGALSVDLGMIWLADLQLQQAVDAATLSGSSELDGTQAGVDKARSTALEIAAGHTILGKPLKLASNAVQVGQLDAKSGLLVPYASPMPPLLVNTVQIVQNGQLVKVGLGGAAFGASTYRVNAQSRSLRAPGGQRAKTTNCYLPIAVPDCHLNGVAAGTNPKPFKFTFSPSPTDAIAWSMPDGNPNSNDLKNQLDGQCVETAVGIGDNIFVNEGSHTSALHTIRDTINGSGVATPTTWNTTAYGVQPARQSSSSITIPNYGKVMEGPIMLINGGNNCGSVKFTGTKAVTGIAWGIIYDTSVSGKDKHIWLQLDLKNPHLTQGQGTNDTGPGSNVLVPTPPQTVAW